MTTELHFREAKRIAANFGLELFRSSKQNKKYMFYHPDTCKPIHFGDTRYDDFLTHKDEYRRDNYRKRHAKIQSADGKPAYKKKFTPAWASYNILW